MERFPSSVTISGKTFGWSSSEPAVATVDATSGLATAVENGTTAITATTDGISGSTALAVEQTATKIVFVTQPGPPPSDPGGWDEVGE